jgi:hypothetical protein
MCRLKDLVRVRIACGPRNDIETELGSLMASVTIFGQLIERFSEAILILCFNGFVELAEGSLYHFVDQLRDRKLSVFVRGMVRRHVVEALVQLIEFVAGQRPISGLSGEPELDVAHLLKRHDFAKAGSVGWFGWFSVAGKQREHHKKAGFAQHEEEISHKKAQKAHKRMLDYIADRKSDISAFQI